MDSMRRAIAPVAITLTLLLGGCGFGGGDGQSETCRELELEADRAQAEFGQAVDDAQAHGWEPGMTDGLEEREVVDQMRYVNDCMDAREEEVYEEIYLGIEP